MPKALIFSKAVNSNNELVEGTSQVVNEKQGKKGSRKKDPYFLILANAQRLFNGQIDTSRCGLYGDCVRIAVVRYNAKQEENSNGFSERQFKSRFTQIVADILDRKSFEKQCNIRKVEPFVAATYVATLNAENRQKVLKGSWGDIPQRFLDCGVPIFDFEELVEFDTNGILKDYLLTRNAADSK